MAILDRFGVERPGARSVSEITDGQVELLLARIAALTDALRGAEPNDATVIATRVLISDLTLVAGQFRGRANGMRKELTTALADLRGAFDGLEGSPAALATPPAPLDDESGAE
jgi:hypothetical protein